MPRPSVTDLANGKYGDGSNGVEGKVTGLLYGDGGAHRREMK